MKYLELQRELVEQYDIELCDGSLCTNDWHRTHAHPDRRRICKWEGKNSAQSTFTLMHEIGHVETFKRSMRRCESEYYATVWALECAREHGFTVPQPLIDRYQRYIFLEYGRGIRRGGKLPDREKFLLPEC